jgi:hypothetical protein
MASIISFTFREAVADVEYKGTHVPSLRPTRSYVTEEGAAWHSFFSLSTCIINSDSDSLYFLGM